MTKCDLKTKKNLKFIILVLLWPDNLYLMHTNYNYLNMRVIVTENEKKIRSTRQNEWMSELIQES